ncbi:RNA polymerase sigma-70 factor [Chryseolinea sp. T2]|uniref:RNA polymerase sigma-70 factor n=1 Tax=Chryseolinea sp. T2 TaxID=3129255 RepID=UPI0030778F00
MDKLKAYSDSALLDLLKVQDAPAFEEIYNRYWRVLYSMIYRRLQSREVSEEIVQDIFTSLWVNRNTVVIHSLSAYLTTAAKYKTINHVARETSRQVYTRQQLELADPQHNNCTEEEVLHDDLNGALEREIEKLPAKRRQIVKLHKTEDLSLKQVANRLGISEKTAENQYGKALKALKLNLKHFTFFSFAIYLMCKVFALVG